MAKAEKKASVKAPVKKAIVKIAAKVVKTAAKAVAKTTAKAGSKNNSKVSSKVNSKASVKEKPKAAVKAKEKIIANKSAKPTAKSVLNVTPKAATVSKEVGKKKTTHLVTVESAEISTIVKSEKPSILRAEFVTEKMAKPAKTPKAPPLSSEAKAALKLEKKNKKLQDIALAGATENLKKWHELKAEYDGEVRAYKMSEQYEAKAAIEHKVLGWGFILSSENNRLDVMFEHGRKMLISNYKA